MAGELESTKRADIVFRTHIIDVQLKDYSYFIARIMDSIHARAENLSIRLANDHMTYSRETITNAALLRPKAKETLQYFLKYKKDNGNVRKVFTDGDVSAMFEVGVREHEVPLSNPNFQNRDRARKWLDDHGLEKETSMIVGGPGSSMARSNAVRFMEKGFNKTMSGASTAYNQEFSQI